MNVIGIQVYRDYCQLVGRVDGEWETMGPPRPLPVEPRAGADPALSDTLVATICQYDSERPGSDLLDVLARRKDFDAALDDPRQAVASSLGP